jgi:hypothetical protein
MVDKESHLTGKEKFTLEKNVYPESAIERDFRMIFKPNRIVLFKMMRACIECQSSDELWLN